jgi:exodeoxyribonuclease VII small subunit
MGEKKPKQKADAEPSFEQALERLEGIVHLLEEGQIGLDEALGRYEEGVKLLRRAFDLLQQAERRIELLSGVDADGNPVCQPFDHEATQARQEKSCRRSASDDVSGGGPDSP